MQEEIKEILDDIKRHLDYVEATKQSSIRDNEMKAMYDCITSLQEEKNDLLDMCSRKIDEVSNLQKENTKLKELCDKYEEEHSTTFEYWKHLVKEDYKSRNEKAIEYIEIGLANEEEAEELLNILQGSDK